MTRLLLVDDTSAITDLLAGRLRTDLGYEVDVFQTVDAYLAAIGPPDGWDIAIVDLSFNQSVLNGADVLLDLNARFPETRRVLNTQGDDWVRDLLRDVWEAIPLASVLGKTMPTNEFLRSIELVLRDGSAPVDPVIRPLLPEQRSPWRRLDSYARLVQHAGHAKLWRVLIASEAEPSYRDLAIATGLSVNTVRNYRDQLLGELRLHGLDNPTMRAMQLFAKRCRPFLQPFIAARLGGDPT
jgi:DNA-binding NarL/FixJ family response regulator